MLLGTFTYKIFLWMYVSISLGHVPRSGIAGLLSIFLRIMLFWNPIGSFLPTANLNLLSALLNEYPEEFMRWQ